MPPAPPRNNQQPPPESDYTRAVAQGGLAALRQQREQRRYGLSGAQQNYSNTGVFSYQQPVARQNDMYDEWLAQIAPQARTQYNYGQTDEGNYAGFKNEGTLKAAIRGRAQYTRDQDAAMFAALDQLAQQRLDDLESEYESAIADAADTYRYEQVATPDTYRSYIDQRNAAAHAPAWSARPQVMSAPGTAPNRIGTGDGEFQSIRDQADPLVTGNNQMPGGQDGGFWTAAQARLGDEQAAAEARSLAAQANRYTAQGLDAANRQYQADELRPWLAAASEPIIEQQDFAQAGLATPITAYTQRAGADYGVDPNIVAGWFPETMALADARDQRDLAFLEQTGMTAADYEQALADMERANTQAAAQGEDAYAQQVDDYGYQLTGGQATTSELADRVNLPIDDVLAILDSADYQMSQATINDALATGDTGIVMQAVTEMLDNAALTDPALLNVLQTIYADYIPSDYDIYGG